MFAVPRPKKSILPPLKKRRKNTSAIEEINFDFDAREEFLTGFHKRKVERAKRAQAEAAKTAKEERIVARKELRENRKRELEEHVEQINAVLREASGVTAIDGVASDDEEWNGIDAEPIEEIDHEAEYIDEDRYTTVTVETVEVSKDGLHAAGEEDEEQAGKAHTPRNDSKDGSELAKPKKAYPPKVRKKKFRYESKGDRKLSRVKQKMGNKRKADSRRGI